ncbi:hypothetical protein EYF80_019345 [Liparis tanakae]|uniref:Uncharacterized protein n=1 Tax=Liparis tanakae TaxID=230148 RepID=A0A4Z2HXS9_9TELE|nr:hypothetical protein EYF80_019345 [Liparis tanakae]
MGPAKLQMRVSWTDSQQKSGFPAAETKSLYSTKTTWLEGLPVQMSRAERAKAKLVDIAKPLF